MKSCLNAHNKTCLLQLQGEGKAFLIGHHLGPKDLKTKFGANLAHFQNSNKKYINLFSTLVYAENPVIFFFFFFSWWVYLVQESEEKKKKGVQVYKRLWSPRRKQMGVYWNWGIGKKKLFLLGFGVPKTAKFSLNCEMWRRKGMPIMHSCYW